MKLITNFQRLGIGFVYPKQVYNNIGLQQMNRCGINHRSDTTMAGSGPGTLTATEAENLAQALVDSQGGSGMAGMAMHTGSGFSLAGQAGSGLSLAGGAEGHKGKKRKPGDMLRQSLMKKIKKSGASASKTLQGTSNYVMKKGIQGGFIFTIAAIIAAISAAATAAAPVAASLATAAAVGAAGATGALIVNKIAGKGYHSGGGVIKLQDFTLAGKQALLKSFEKLKKNPSMQGVAQLAKTMSPFANAILRKKAGMGGMGIGKVEFKKNFVKEFKSALVG